MLPARPHPQRVAAMATSLDKRPVERLAMLTLTLLRHAKSSWDSVELEDFDRPLNDRGRKAAPAAARDLVRLKLLPDLILCSTARRTRETLALVLPELGKAKAAVKPSVIFEDDLYLAFVTALLERIRRIEDGPRSVLLVGHNPGLQGLALALIGAGEGEDIAALADKFPTAAIAAMTFEAERWAAVEPAGGRLIHFVTPKR